MTAEVVTSAGPFVVVLETRFPRNVELSEFANELLRVRKEYMYLGTAKAGITRELKRWMAAGYQWREVRLDDAQRERRFDLEFYTETESGSTKLTHAGSITFRIYRVEDGELRYYTDQYMFTGR